MSAGRGAQGRPGAPRTSSILYHIRPPRRTKAREYRVVGCPEGDGGAIDRQIVEAVESGILPARAVPLLAGLKCGDTVSSTTLARKSAEISARPSSYGYRMSRGLAALRAAEEAGIVEIVDKRPSITLAEFVRLPSVAYWLKTLSGTDFQHDLASSGLTGTRRAYASRLYKFHGWLAGRTVSLTRWRRVADGYEKTQEEVVLSGVEGLLDLYLAPESNARDLNRIAREFLSEVRDDPALSVASVRSAETALKSYFEMHEVSYSVRFRMRRARGRQPGARGGGGGAGGDSDDWADNSLTLGDFATILTAGRPNFLEKSVFLSMFHRGLDRATIADRFNYTAFDQVSAHMGTDDPRNWSLDKCPVPVVLARVKTAYRHTGFLERDAVSAMQDWLYDRERRTCRRLRRGDGSPLYITQHGCPIRDSWVHRCFAKLSVRAGLVRQRPEGRESPSRHSHQLRKLIKSTLIDAGCRMDVADHVIGHVPKDAYEVQASLYPESLRREYAKGAARINIFTRMASVVDGGDGSESLRAQVADMSARMDRMAGDHKRLLARYGEEESARGEGGDDSPAAAGGGGP